MGALATTANMFGREFEHILIDVDDCIYRIHEIPLNVYNNITGEGESTVVGLTRYLGHLEACLCAFEPVCRKIDRYCRAIYVCISAVVLTCTSGYSWNRGKDKGCACIRLTRPSVCCQVI